MRRVYSKFMLADTVKNVGRECGFELVGIAGAGPVGDFARYDAWVASGHAGEMRYLTDHRAQIRRDVRALLPSAKSVICVGKLYNTGQPLRKRGDARIARYAGGTDYHTSMKKSLEAMAARLRQYEAFDFKVCVDTAPLLERSLARDAGLGWIGKNTCLINEPKGSWFFLGEIITSLNLHTDTPPPDRCGSCTSCIDACPTQAIVPQGEGWAVDSRRCISYLTIELRGPIPEQHRAGIGTHVFGCDICQDVCPWNRRAPLTGDTAYAGKPVTLEEIAEASPQEFRARFGDTPVSRAKHSGMLRNVAVAMGNIGPEHYREWLLELAQHPDPMVQEHAAWALGNT
ncbi:MAG: tRNA epoxyqueuosine(34) reductase QueG [Acidobacteriota bacterium]